MFTRNLTRHSGSASSLTRRAFAVSRGAMVKAENLSISQNEDEATIVKQTTELVDNGQWRVCDDGKGLERFFKFKTFASTWKFMNKVAEECKIQKHHPEWSNVYNKTHIRWTTHNPEGLSSRDIHMAEFCDQAGQEFGELQADPTEFKLGPDGKVEAGGCCSGKQ